jgi:type IV secretion system protein VirB10
MSKQENQGNQENFTNEPSQEQEQESPEVQHELSQVASNPKRNMLVLAGVCSVLGYFAINIFFSSSPSAPQNQKPAAPLEVVKPAEVKGSDIPSIPQLPEPPKLVEPTAPSSSDETPANNDVLPPPPLPIKKDDKAPPTLPTTGNAVAGAPVISSEGDEARKRQETKRKSNIILLAGKEETKSKEQLEQEADFKYRGNTELILGRGKILDAVLESAINTDFGGEVRAVISRDVFSESGRVILIPKGTRIFGSYSNSVAGAYGRISIEWNRIDLATGYTLNLQGSGVDNLGRKGAQGRVDDKFREKFANAILTSIFNVAAAKAIDQLVPPVESNQTTAQNTALATNINNIALAINNDATQQPATKIANICTQVQNAIPDKSSTAYTTFQQTCFSLQSNAGGATAAQQLASLMSSVNSAATSLIQNTTNASTPTKAQDAAKQGFDDITKVVTNELASEQFKTTITIDQGTPVKIYVNKDYKFPKEAIRKQKVLE